MFNKVLIANRGAIACRIIRTLRRMGITSVAIFSEADRQSLHVRQADEAICIGPASPAQSYLDASRILQVAKDTGVDAIHPGYGFLSENAEFAEACAAVNICFIGPDPAQMRLFGLKHRARALAAEYKVALLPGSSLLNSAAEALEQAEIVTYPLMLKSTAGGGGIGMQLCRNAVDLEEAFHSVERLAQSHFSQGGIFIEKFVETARHIEVQIFGDGNGHVVHLGERDCSVQRRNQKVIEETPAPGIRDEVRQQLCDAAVALGKAINYCSAGTVEFLYDTQSEDFYFLEVNTRLQVEHGVTEEVTGIDLVEWMLNIAAGDMQCLLDWRNSQHSQSKELNKRLKKHAIQVRIYAEDPGKSFQPSVGRLTDVAWPGQLRVDSWVETGTEVSPYYDPMLAKIIASGSNREEALKELISGLSFTRIAGIETNLDYLRQVLNDSVFAEVSHTTSYLNNFAFKPHTVDVIHGGTQTLLVDYPGRLGYWNVGIPPSGPIDDYAERLANRILNNPIGLPALEITVSGPVLRFNYPCCIALTGATLLAKLNGVAIEFYKPIKVEEGSTLKLGAIEGAGVRAYLAIRGGFDVPEYMGSKTTFTLGQFGGHGGRALRAGDVLRLQADADTYSETMNDVLPTELIPQYTEHWNISVLYGPHGAPDFFTNEDVETFFSSNYEVHYNSSRTGVRLIGPKPNWARSDGGEAGLHPSNIHDNAYAVGTIDFTGDMPIILGPDGPSLGGFVCPATIITADLWKIGQLKPGDKIRFICVDNGQANEALLRQEKVIATLKSVPFLALDSETPVQKKPQNHTQIPDQKQTQKITAGISPILARIAAQDNHPEICYRQAGDRYLLIEYGPLVLDVELRFRVHALMSQLVSREMPGIIDLTPGIRSLQVHYDSGVITQLALLDLLQATELELGSIAEMEVPSRVVHLPLSWDDPSTRLAIERYSQSVRADAPWSPSNIEFIRRINGLSSVDDVKQVVFDASYLVLGLGDVYLGAPVATPMDPRHRLVTTKYNPARTWTPENAVGIGGAYLCIYGMEGPGGYQFVGRTIQMWNRYRQTDSFIEGKQWLLRFFDQIRFYEVSHEELNILREDFPLGHFSPCIEESSVKLSQYRQFLIDNNTEINAFKRHQQQAFETERHNWEATGQAHYESESPDDLVPSEALFDLPPGCIALAAAVTGSVWQLEIAVGDLVETEDSLVVIEAMKMEVALRTDQPGVIREILCRPGDAVKAGQVLVILQVADDPERQAE